MAAERTSFIITMEILTSLAATEATNSEQPARTNASSFSPLSSSHSQPSPDEAQPSSLSSGEQSPTRGRTLHRVPAQDRRTSRARPRRRWIADVHPDVESAAMASRLLSRDLSTTPEDYDESILEPRPYERCRTSLSEQLHRTSTYESTLEMHFGAHRDTFAVMGFRRLKARAAELSDSFFDRLVLYLDYESYLNLRLSCRKWSAATTRARPLTLPTVSKFPAEIIQKFYCQLHPIDFNAARHTCRAWMIASLEEKLLHHMLKLGGWLQASRMDVALQEMPQASRTLNIISDEWLLSKRLATECSMRPGWTGNGLGDSEQYIKSTIQSLPKSRLHLTSETSFSDLGHDHGPSLAPHFTISACGGFLLIVNGCNIFIYQLKLDLQGASHPYGGYLQLFSVKKCPQRVLAVSMDTSSGRFVVAALLENRTGLVCESHPKDVDDNLRQAASSAWRSSSTINSATHMTESRDSMRLEAGPETFYRDLCSDGDPPRSVAICPQRRCVAFGSSIGIELHWRDILTGQDMSRWFALSSPSDFLYFMPEAQGTDASERNKKKLRLLSSGAPPNPTHGKTASFSASLGQDSSLSSDDVDGTSISPPTLETRQATEYFKAIPMSDGSVLFTDPATGCLCLAREGQSRQRAFDRTLLVRKFVFEGSYPTAYAAGKDLRWGVRIVAGFAGKIMLFTVSADIYHEGNEGNDPENLQPVHSDIHARPAPAMTRGVQIGHLANLVELSVDSADGDLTVWAFTADGTVYVWQLAGGMERTVVKRRVLANGTISSTSDADSDIVMEDISFDEGHIDDIDSSPPSCSDTRKSEELNVIGEDGDIVLGGMEQEDGGYVSDDEYEYGQAGGPFAIHAPPLWGRWSEDDADWVPQYLAERGGEIEDEGLGVDVLELCRLECEVMSGS